ncbi:23S rRNA (adenine(1618)-N(6))-methyltransferase RlmF [Pontibacterium granulatum]|uniref:23S rRNA (adenine(1618)-N(6))-methyltransferase RlmF n=1 Tax=Pontibacterium granulatum TaxID=2036029 RepID=UPI00249A38CD|nr:23S rRNA (adenine(1618)-N(6))-methyltransferase RlmF [Pontibacterium granulatum]MDI3325700.1 23S rRNA (adenine(1618)-N(6))-methyltransferase RlmF [Pontibacterium granulatum]
MSGNPMAPRASKPVSRKPGLHSRNPHAGRYDLPKLIAACPELEPFVAENRCGDLSVDFADPAAVKVLNKALLIHHYGLLHWDIPPGYLCPPVPGRADYIHHLADLLARDNGGEVPVGRGIRGLDIGTGANLIYPIVGQRSYGWAFVGTEIDPLATASAKLISEANPVLKGAIRLRQQKQPQQIFNGVIKRDELFDFTLCNPPFHASAETAAAGTRRKLKNLGLDKTAKAKPTLNFGGQNNELWCPGGELAFVRTMVEESQAFAGQVCWFTSLIANGDNLSPLKKTLKQAGAVSVEVIPMGQGNKVSRILVWSFLSEDDRRQWAASR